MFVAAQVEATTTWADRGERKLQSAQSSLVEINFSTSDRFCLGDYAEGFPQCHQPLIRRSPPVYPSSYLQSYHATLMTSSKSARLYSVQCLLLRLAIQSELLVCPNYTFLVYGCSTAVPYGAYQFHLHCCIAIYSTFPSIQQSRSLTNSQVSMSTGPKMTIFSMPYCW